MSQTALSDETITAVEECQRQLPEEFPNAELVFGFSGVIDNVRTMVDTRHSQTSFDRLETLATLRDRLDESVSSESSLAIEWVNNGTRTGGHACHLTRAFSGWGAKTTMVGTYGQPVNEVFASEFADSDIVSIGRPGFCDAVEFDDGKLMLAEHSEASQLDWEMLRERVGVDRLAEHLDGADVLGVGYWNVTTALPEIVANLVEETWSLQESPPQSVFFDTGDIRNLPAESLREGATHLEAANRTVPVTVSANRVETTALAESLAAHSETDFREDARVIFDNLDVDRYVGHGVTEAVTVTNEECVAVQVPKTADPELTTSAGDHFNAGLLMGMVAGLSDPVATVALTLARIFDERPWVFGGWSRGYFLVTGRRSSLNVGTVVGRSARQLMNVPNVEQVSFVDI